MAACENDLNNSTDVQASCDYRIRLPPPVPTVDQFPDEVSGIIDDSTFTVFQIVNFVVLYGVIAVSGSLANIINAIILVKLGFKKTVNIGFFGIALTDLGGLVALLWLSICFNPLFAFSPVVPFAPYEVQYLSGGWLRICFVRVSSWYTAYVAFERCLCVAMPLKVKVLVTPRRVVAVMVTIAVVVVASLSPVCFTTSLQWKFYPIYNRTLIGLVFTENREEVEQVTYLLNNFIFPWSSFIMVCICTVVLVVNLKSKSKWRAASTATSKIQDGGDVSSRDRTIVRMVIALSTIFIISSAPGTVAHVVMSFIPEYSITGRYQNLFNVSFSFIFILESINSSVNILVFYRMSTEYRNMFKKVFARCTKEGKD